MKMTTRGIIAGSLVAAGMAIFFVRPSSRQVQMKRVSRRLMKGAAGWLARQLQAV